MVPSGPPTPVGGTQTVSPSTLLRTNSGLLGAQGGAPAQPAFPSLVSPRSQYGNMNLLGNMPNVSSLLGGAGAAGICVNQSFANGGNGPQPSGSNSGLSASGSFQRGVVDMGAESDPLSGFNSSPSSFGPQNAAIPCTSGLNGSLVGSGGATLQQQGQAQVQHFSNSNSTQIAQDQQQPQQLEVQNFQQGHHGQQGQDPSNNLQMQPQQMLGGRGLQQFPVPNSLGMGASQQQQFQSLRGLSSEQTGQQQLQPLRNLAPVKLEPHMTNDQTGQQHLSSLRNIGPVKLEPQQLALRNLPSIKMEHQHLDQSLLMQQQQQQQFLQMSRQSSQQMQLQAAQLNLLQHQRLLQLQQQQQQQQQQQMLKALPPQRSQMQQPLQQFQQQNLPMRSSVKPAIYESGMGARRLTHYMYHQQRRPADNNIEFWRKFVAEYFAPHAKKRWCVSLYGTGRQTTGVFPQDVWHCEICKRKPGRGFETTVEVLPRLCKIKYDSGTLEELLYVDMPREYQAASGQIVLDYAKAIQESVFEQLRVVRDGHLRIVFSSDLKICSWEFCARRHEELIPRRLIIPQVTQLGLVAQKYQAASQNGLSNLSSQDLQNNCNLFVATARQMAKALEVPLVNDLGYTKRYVRCLQISEVVNSMKDLIDYSRETGTGPMASLINFPRRNSTGLHSQNQQTEEQATQNSNNEHNSVQATLPLSTGNGLVSLNASANAPSTSTSTSTIVGLLHQNSMNFRQENNGPLNNSSSPFGNSVQIPSATSSNSLQQSQPNPSSPFQNPTQSASNNPQQLPNSATQMNSVTSPANISAQQSTQSNEIDPNDCQNSVQQIIQEMMMSSQLNRGNNNMVGALGNEIKSLNGITQTGNSTVNGGNCLAGMGFGNVGGASGGMRASMTHNSLALNGRGLGQETSMNNNHQQDLGSRFLGGLGTSNSFNNLQFDWKSSP